MRVKADQIEILRCQCRGDGSRGISGLDWQAELGVEMPGRHRGVCVRLDTGIAAQPDADALAERSGDPVERGEFRQVVHDDSPDARFDRHPQFICPLALPCMWIRSAGMPPCRAMCSSPPEFTSSPTRSSVSIWTSAVQRNAFEA